MKWFAVFFFFISPLFASIEEAYNQFTSLPGIKESSVAICVEGHFSDNADKSKSPASLIKLMTTAAAFDQLGPDYQFCTELYYKGRVTQGVLVGDIILKGDGDPTLGSHRFGVDMFEHWANALKENDIHMMKGRIVVDATCFEKEMAAPTWLLEDLGNYYGVGPSGLSFHENMYNLVYEPTEVGELANIVSGPSYLKSEVRTGVKGSGDQAYIFGTEYGERQVARGTIPTGSPTFTIKGAMLNPPMHVAESLHSHLDQNGAIIGCKVVSEKVPNDAVLIDQYHSFPLNQLVRLTNHFSINLYADSLFKKIGHGSFDGGAKAVREYLQDLGVKTTGLQLKDGSGLSEKNLVTPRQFVQLLDKVKSEPYFSYFYESLPVMGESGTLKNLGKNSGVKGIVAAKTASNSTTFSLAGYIKGVPFSIMVNNCLIPKSRVKHHLIPLLEAIALELE